MQMRSVLFAGIALFAVTVAVGASWWYFDWGHSPVEELPHLHGQPLAVVITKLGEPNRQLDYTMAECPGGELRGPLYNVYPREDPKATQARIKELRWDRARYHVAVWLHHIDGAWVVLDTCRWRADVQF